MPQPPRKNRFSKSSAETSEPRRIALNLSSTAVAALALALAAVMGWAFFMGLMVGRGQNPEQRVEQMASALRSDPPMAQDAQPPTAEPAPAPAAPEGQPPIAENPAPPPETYQFSRPQGAEMGAWGIRSPETAEAKPSPGTHAASSAPAQTTIDQTRKQNAPLFDYLFQAAAFKNKKDVDALRDSLEKRGIRSSRNKSGKVFLVMVHLRGSEADAANLREELQKMKLGAPILTSKKPVAAPKRKIGR
ncbi:MAG: SPOR domain-containing protein [Desulfovibrio sp.]|jgi:cell division septation protein DedD|nr:SPOR domain-containing protein [Desulfovibrio sp.]